MFCHYFLLRGNSMFNSKQERAIKCLFLGHRNSSKSKVFQVCRDDQNHNASVVVDFCNTEVNIDSATFNVQLWDMATHERFRSVTQSFFNNAHGILLVCDANDRQTLMEAKKLNQLSRESTLNKMSYVMIFVTDNNPKNSVTFSEVNEFCKEQNMACISINSITKEQVLRALETLIKQIRNVNSSGTELQNKKGCSIM